jgi:PBSX family phage portal protein
MADEKNKSGAEISAMYVRPKEQTALFKLAGSASPIESNSLEYEDEFKGTYGPSMPQGAKAQILEPPVLPKTLMALCHQNNTLMTCIDAYVTNVHGMGHDVVLDVPGTETNSNPMKTDPPEVKAVKDFLSEVWPMMSFLELRKLTGTETQQCGNGYWELLRDWPNKDLQMIRPLDAKLMRLVALSDPVVVPVTVRRNGGETTLQVVRRFRRFVQSIGTKFVFYKEYGCPLLINKNTGELLEDVAANRVKLFRDKAMGTEVMHFRAMDDVETPYGVPQWWPQMPSVLGQRKAEEFNLDYFEAGGVPPLMIFVQGGTLGSTMKDALEEFLSSKPGAKQGAPVFEVQSTGGSLDNPGQGARVLVEKFGTERQKDSMFEAYDEKCEERIRRAWRLPPIFVGKSNDYNLACYDEQTETLTDQGWIKHDQFKPGMKVATFNRDKRTIEYQEPVGGPLVYDVENLEMYHFANKAVDLMVTPKHRMLFGVARLGKEFLLPIEAMVNMARRVKFVAKALDYLEGQEQAKFLLPWRPLRGGRNAVQDAPPLPVPADDFLQLIGWYLSEGCLLPQGNAIRLMQDEGRYWDEIKALLKRFERNGFTVWWDANKNCNVKSVTLASKSLYCWLKDNGAAGYSWQKRVPRCLMELPKHQLRVLFDAMMRGDGTWDAREGRTSGAYSTTSSGLADDVQEIALKLGYRASIREDRPGTKGDKPVFRVLLSTAGPRGSTGEFYDIRMDRDMKRELYTGKVYCFSVPNGVFVTRRNGKISIQGNTAQASYQVAEAQVFKPERDSFDERMNKTVILEIDKSGKAKLRSLGLPVKDVNQQLLAITQAFLADALDVEHFVDLLNEVTALHMEVRPEARAEHQTKIQAKLDLMVNSAKLQAQPAIGNASGKPKPTANSGQKGRGSQSTASSSSPKPKISVRASDLLGLDERQMLANVLNDPNEELTFKDKIESIYEILAQ